MTDQEIIKSFQDAGALLDGHFVLRSGMHSNKFFQCALLFRYPDVAEKLCRTLAERMKDLGATTVISPISRVFCSTRVQKHQFFNTQPSLRPNSHIHT